MVLFGAVKHESSEFDTETQQISFFFELVSNSGVAPDVLDVTVPTEQHHTVIAHHDLQCIQTVTHALLNTDVALPPQGDGDGNDAAISAIVQQEPAVALPFAVEVAGPSAGPSLAPAPNTLVLSSQNTPASGRRLLQGVLTAICNQSPIRQPELQGKLNDGKANLRSIQEVVYRKLNCPLVVMTSMSTGAAHGGPVWYTRSHITNQGTSVCSCTQWHTCRFCFCTHPCHSRRRHRQAVMASLHQGRSKRHGRGLGASPGRQLWQQEGVLHLLHRRCSGIALSAVNCRQL